ncbi:MAG: translation initiation factor IF-3 [Candidatus Eremiobacteraeota bacterium]|nr:translation initiation factor IF-3 [Candidatus Eremiobacteraeota bacterium]
MRRRRRWVSKKPEFEHRVNERIRAPKIRVVGAEGDQLGVMHPRQALTLAKEKELDLVEVAPNASPPVCRLMDYGRWRYENSKKKSAKKTTPELREVKMRPKIDEHDYQVKCRIVKRLLRGGDKVKVTMRFRGREVTHDDIARDILLRVRDDAEDLGRLESKPNRQGRSMSMVLAPSGEVQA